MKRNRITIRLLLYFAFSLLLFSLLLGAFFSWQFSRYSMELHRQELADRAVRIAGTMSEFMDTGASRHGQGYGHSSSSQGGGYGAYLRFLDDIAMSDIWIVDNDADLITRGQGHGSISYKELPEDAEQVIAKVQQGDIAFSESFSSLLEQKTLTAGAPILSSRGDVLGAVLLHSPVQGYESVRQKQLQIMMISILLALLLTVPISIFLSLRFTKPLRQIKQNALMLAEEHYDVTNNISQKDEIGELADSMDILAARLETARREREQMEQSRRIFLSNVSHELRTPVTVMRGSLEALCDDVVSDPQQIQEYHQQMLRESIHMQRLVNDLLELSRLQNPDFRMETEPVNLCEIVEDVARSMRHVAEEKGVSIQIQGGERDAQMMGDYSRLRQMLMAVVDNAVKFSPAGETVEISTSSTASGCILSVVDHGQGISEEMLPRIFERFHKGGEDNPQGTGLGLAIAKEIASRHKIDITVESMPGRTVFACYLSL